LKEALLVNWDSYPNFTTGGVYTWEETLLTALSDWKFSVINFLSNPNCNGKYAVPPNVRRVIEVPIFGSNRYEEYHTDTMTFLAKTSRTTNSVIENQFVPLFRRFLEVTLSDKSDVAAIRDIIIKLHQFLGVYDSKKCLDHPVTWETFLGTLMADSAYEQMSLRAALTAFQIIQRNVQVLAIDIPKVDLIHSSLAWLPSLVAVCGKEECGCPVILTEHGVAFRELLLYYSAYLYDEPSKIFFKIFSKNVVRTIYSIADVITPVCEANAAWERLLGADAEKIRVIHNGVNTKRFRPLPVNRIDRSPTVVCVGRIDPFKDIVGLLNAIDVARKSVPNIRCLIYGSALDLDFSMSCVRALKELKLERNVKFMGATREPEKAYNLADVVVCSAITEGFPFSVIEAMACGKAVVASDVGGVREALDGAGVLVKSRRPTELAQAIVMLLGNERLRNQLGIQALKRANELFTFEQCVRKYHSLYEELADPQKMNLQNDSGERRVIAK
jgi:glycosyltransferase involved in cell wall biosynthesis